KTAGAIKVQSDTALEFGALALGGTATKTVTLSNTESAETSQVKLRIATSSSAFAVSESEVTLGPGESHALTITYSPTAAMHQYARLGLAVNASNRQALSFLTHGYGGAAPDNGPTLGGDPIYFTEIAPQALGLGIFGYMPDGRRFFADNSVH